MQRRIPFLPALFVLLPILAFACGAPMHRTSIPAPQQALVIPWDLAALSKTPTMTWIDTTSPVRTLTYRGLPFQSAPTSVYACYASPATIEGRKAGKREFPAVVLVHGGGGQAFPEWAELWARRGYAAIAMDLSNGSDGKRLPDGGPGGDRWVFGAVDGPIGDQWTYHAVADVILAHSLIRSFPEVDPDRTGVTGISWGGYLTCITAGVDNRFKAAAPVYGCGFLYENSTWLGTFRKMTVQQRARWVELWDPSRYVGSAAMPVFFLDGTNDFAYPLDSFQKTYQLVTAPRTLRITSAMRHSHIDGWAPAEIGLFMDQHLRDGDPLPVVGLPAWKDSTVTATVETSRPIFGASLFYTTGTGRINGRQWISRPASVQDSLIIASVPPADATLWFLTVTDDRNATVSSELIFEARTPYEHIQPVH